MRIIVFFLCLSCFQACENPSEDKEQDVCIDYQVAWPKKTPTFLSVLFKKHLISKQEEERSIPSLALLAQRAKRDVKTIKQILQSFGFFERVVDYDLQMDHTPLRLKFRIHLGPRYKIQKIKFEHMPIVPCPLARLVQTKEGDFLNTQSVLDDVERLKDYFENHGYPFVKMPTPEITLDNEHHTLELTYKITSGPLVHFKKVTIEGLKTLNKSYILNHLDWQESTPYSKERVDQTKKSLIESNLFSSLSIEPLLDSSTIRIKATELLPRVIGVGLFYDRTNKLTGQVYWHHYNFFGKAEHLQLRVRGSHIETSGYIGYDISDFLKPRHSLTHSLFLARENKVAYVGKRFEARQSIEWYLSKSLKIGVGGRFETGHMIQDLTDHRYMLFGPNVSATLDRRSDKINPKSGFIASLSTTPYFGIIKTANPTQKAGGLLLIEGTLRTYTPIIYQLFSCKELVWANFIHTGNIIASKLEKIPPNKRFYLGGANSVRAYAYQLLGPLDALNNPIGGESYSEFGTEVRARFSKTIGAVMFIEGGQVFKKVIQNPFKNILWGAGVGLRYYSTLGPIRADIAFPLKSRSIDSKFQFYVGIGHSF